MLKGLFLVLLSAMLLSIFLLGCCGYTEEPKTGTNGTGQPAKNRAPDVYIGINNATSGQAPFTPVYSYHCYDPDNNLAYCELRIDGRAYAHAEDQAGLMPEGYQKPQFYYDAGNAVGEHALEIYAVDSEGLGAAADATFEVLPPPPLSKPGWYLCNNKPDAEPCASYMEMYCDKFDQEDLAVRKAASDAVAKHPGALSVNQLLDIYDWVHANVFYHNVPLDMYPPYYPNETLATKSGDCKNQAVLLASMVQSVGGSARVMIVPECHHAFTEVYLGTEIDTAAMAKAIRAHYQGAGTVTWHENRRADNKTDYWFIFDTAGGNFPGETIPGCLNATRIFELRDCSRSTDQLNAPTTEGTAYGPTTIIDDTKVVPAGWNWNYWPDTGIGPNGYSWCSMKLSISSLSPTPFNWYITDQAGYQKAEARQSFTYWGGAEQVSRADYEFNWDKPGKIYLVLRNLNQQNSITLKINLAKTCYK